MEHLPNTGELVLAIQRQDHAKQAVELRASCIGQRRTTGEGLLLFGFGQVHITTQT